MKKSTLAWAIKLRGRSFYQNLDGVPFLYMTKSNASMVAMRIKNMDNIRAEPARVKVRIEEIE